MASVSDVFTALGQTTMRVLWELGVEPLDEQSCEYVNCLTAITTNEFHSFIHARGISLEAAATAYTEAFEAHLALETASLAASIEHRASRPRLRRDLKPVDPDGPAPNAVSPVFKRRSAARPDGSPATTLSCKRASTS
jgi:hypothetical protein